MAAAPRKSVVQLAFEMNAVSERRERRIKKTYAPAPEPAASVKKKPAPKGRK